MFLKANLRRHAWNCDLSTKPGTDILTNRHIYIWRCLIGIPVVPRKAVAEVLSERLAAVNHGWQSAPIDGSKGG